MLATLKIAQICTINIRFVAGLDPIGFSKSNNTVPLFISMSEKDLTAHLVIHQDTRTNSSLYKAPLKGLGGKPIFQLLSLRNFLDGELDLEGVQTICAIKFVCDPCKID